MALDPHRPWTLVNFEVRLEQWEQLENPPPDLLIVINAWLLELIDDALKGQRMRDKPGWRFAVIPGTHNGTDMVTCIFQAYEETRTAKCSFFAYQAPPFGPA